MLDSKGRELKVGDTVAFVLGKNSSASIDTGKITKFYTNHYGEDECSVQYYDNEKLRNQSHILSFRVMKLAEENVEELNEMEM